MGKAKSIITENMSECWVCGSPNTQIHHICYGGANRKLSDRYGLVIPLCPYHHLDSREGVHFDNDLNMALRKLAQKKFEERYPDLSFRAIFGQNYL